MPIKSKILDELLESFKAQNVSDPYKRRGFRRSMRAAARAARGENPNILFPTLRSPRKITSQILQAAGHGQGDVTGLIGAALIGASPFLPDIASEITHGVGAMHAGIAAFRKARSAYKIHKALAELYTSKLRNKKWQQMAQTLRHARNRDIALAMLYGATPFAGEIARGVSRLVRGATKRMRAEAVKAKAEAAKAKAEAIKAKAETLRLKEELLKLKKQEQ